MRRDWCVLMKRMMLCGIVGMLACSMAACDDEEEIKETETTQAELEVDDSEACLDYLGVWCAYGDQSDSWLEICEDGSWTIDSLNDGMGGGTWRGLEDGIELTADDDVVVGELRFEGYNKVYAYMDENYCGMFGNWFMPYHKSCDAESELYAERWGLGGDILLDFESQGSWIAPIHGYMYNDDGDYAIIPVEVEAYKFHDAMENEMHELGFKVVISYPKEGMPSMSNIHHGFKNVFFDAYNGERIPFSGLRGDSANKSSTVEVLRDGRNYIIDLICDCQWEYPKDDVYRAVATYTVQASMPQDYEGLRYMVMPAPESYDKMNYYAEQKYAKHADIYECYGDRIRQSFMIVVN